MLTWTGKPWAEQETGPKPAGWGGGLDDNLAPFRSRDPLTGKPAPIDPAFYRVVGRAGVERLKPRNQPVTVGGLLGLCYLIVIAGLLAGGVLFWIERVNVWMR